MLHEGEESHIGSVALDPKKARFRSHRSRLIEEGEDRIFADIGIAVVGIDIDFLDPFGLWFPAEMISALEVELVFVLRPVCGALSADTAENVVIKLAFKIEGPSGPSTRVCCSDIFDKPMHDRLVNRDARIADHSSKVLS